MTCWLVAKFEFPLWGVFALLRGQFGKLRSRDTHVSERMSLCSFHSP